MLEIIIIQSSKIHKTVNMIQINWKNGKYSLMDRFYCEHGIKVYKYAFMYVYRETIIEEG